MKNLKNIAVVVGLVLACIVALSVGYYFVIVLPAQAQAKLDLEQQKFDADQKEKQNKIDAEQKAAQDKADEAAKKRTDLDICLALADANYSAAWDSACITWKQDVDLAWKRCRNDQYSWETDAENKQRCVPITPDYKTDSRDTCLLPNPRSTTLEDRKEKDKEECYKLNK